MKRPIARPTAQAPDDSAFVRAPRAFAPGAVELSDNPFDAPDAESLVAPPAKSMGWLGRLVWASGGILVSAGLGLAADRLIRDLFAANEWLGWLGLAVLGLFVLAVIALAAREMLALRRLRVLDSLRADAALATTDNDQHMATRVVDKLSAI